MASYEQAKSLLYGSVSRRTLYSLDIYNNALSRREKAYFRLYANRITMPSVSHEVVPTIGQENMGIMRKTPTGFQYGGNAMMIEAIEDSNFTVYDSVRRMFDQTGVNSNPNARSGNRSQRMNYYNDYVFEMTLTKLEFPNGPKSLPDITNEAIMIDYGYKRVAQYKFANCFVSNIGDMVFDAAARDDYLSFPVEFTYESYYHDKTKSYDLETQFGFRG